MSIENSPNTQTSIKLASIDLARWAELIVAICAFLAISMPARAQNALTPKDQFAVIDGRAVGWTYDALLGATLTFASSDGVVGQADGNTESYGLNLASTIFYIVDLSEWRNSFSYAGVVGRTTSLPRFTKSSDELSLETIYLRSLPSAPKFGPYARASLMAPVFHGEDIRGDTRTYLINRNDGTATTITTSTLALTDGFRPLTTREAIGVFWKARSSEDLKIEVRAGFGAQQVIADGQLVLGEADKVTGIVSVKELESYSQAGLETGVSVKGKLAEESGYQANLEILTPFFRNEAVGDDRSALRMTNVMGSLKLTTKAGKWLTFSYDYKLAIQPQLLDRAQQSHLIGIGLQYVLL